MQGWTMNKLVGVISISFILSGCYSNWPQLDSFADHIDCDTTKSQLIALADQHQTAYQWDDQYQVLSVNKADDALAIQFVAVSYGSDLIRLDTVTAVKSQITFFGLDRTQGDPYLILRCNMPTLPKSWA